MGFDSGETREKMVWVSIPGSGNGAYSNMLGAVMHRPHVGHLEMMVKRSRALAVILTRDQLIFVLQLPSIYHQADAAKIENFESTQDNLGLQD